MKMDGKGQGSWSCSLGERLQELARGVVMLWDPPSLPSPSQQLLSHVHSLQRNSLVVFLFSFKTCFSQNWSRSYDFSYLTHLRFKAHLQFGFFFLVGFYFCTHCFKLDQLAVQSFQLLWCGQSGVQLAWFPLLSITFCIIKLESNFGWFWFFFFLGIPQCYKFHPRSNGRF